MGGVPIQRSKRPPKNADKKRAGQPGPARAQERVPEKELARRKAVAWRLASLGGRPPEELIYEFRQMCVKAGHEVSERVAQDYIRVAHAEIAGIVWDKKAERNRSAVRSLQIGAEARNKGQLHVAVTAEQRFSKLLGLDAPTEVNLEVDATANIRAVFQELNPEEIEQLVQRGQQERLRRVGNG